MHKFHFRFKTVPWALLFLCLASFGILIPQLGFYWDDWPMMWFAHALGPTGFPGVFSGDRPFLSLVYIITTALLDTIPWQWQLLAIFTRWLAALTLWWTLLQVWPKQTRAVTWIAALYAVYPGFKQMPISVVYGNGLILVIPYIASYGWMIKAIRNPGKYWGYTVLALAGYLFCTISTEYYVGLDLIRGVFLWLVLGETIRDWRKRAYAVVRHWLPYLFVLGGFLVWRVLIFQFPTYQPELLGAVNGSPIRTILDLLYRIVHDVYTAGWQNWVEPFAFPNLEDFSISSNAAAWALTLVLSLASLVYFSRLVLEKDEQPAGAAENNTSWAKTAVLTGLIGVIVPGLPYWVTSLPLTLSFPYDRFHLAFMIGSCIFIVGLVELVIRTRTQKIVLLSLIIGMSAGAHLLNANTYRREWMTQKQLFWQLSWRAPGLKPGTYLLTDELPLRYYSDNSLTAPFNWIYAQPSEDLSLPYYLGFSKVRLGAGLPALENGLPIEQRFRNMTFKGNTSQVLVFFYSPPGCLRILDPERDSDIPTYPENFYEMMAISHPDQVITDPEHPAVPPENIFGLPPEGTWCYYFEKADLARQRGDWAEVVRLGDEGIPGHVAEDPSELLVFMEGYAHVGNWQRVTDLVYDAYDRSKNLQTRLCKTIFELKNETQPGENDLALIKKAQSTLECPAKFR